MAARACSLHRGPCSLPQPDPLPTPQALTTHPSHAGTQVKLGPAWVRRMNKPHLVLRADMSPAKTYWICCTVREEGRYYVAASPIARSRGLRNTPRIEEAGRYPTREAAEDMRPLGDAGTGEAYSIKEGKLLCFEPGQWKSDEAPEADYAYPPEPACPTCAGTLTEKHTTWECQTLRDQDRAYLAKLTAT